MAEPLRIALAGLGTVGGGVIRLIETNGALIGAPRRDARSQSPRSAPATAPRIAASTLSRYTWEDDMTLLAERADVDVVVELVGGADGPALALARRTLAAGQGAGHRQQGNDRAPRE
jgi:homoserine dehydrogenase